jgi:hypothetical protein
MRFERIEVECYSGQRANERPRVIRYRGERIEVTEILDRWYEGDRTGTRPALDYFRVRCADGSVWLLRYNSLFDAWARLDPPT